MNVFNIVARSISSHVLNVDKEIVFKVKTNKIVKYILVV